MGFCLLNRTEPADEVHKGAPFWLAYNSPLGQRLLAAGLEHLKPGGKKQQQAVGLWVDEAW